MKIAIVGSGISGLTAAWLLCPEHEITVFEAGGHVGGHTLTAEVRLEGERQSVDMGFIVFNENHYPLFFRLLQRLGIVSQPTSMSFSVRCDRTGLEYNGTSFQTLFAQRRNLFRPPFWRMLRDIARFNREAAALLGPAANETTVEEFVRQGKYGASFLEHYLIPLGSSLWSSPREEFLRFPIRFVARFLNNHEMLQATGRSLWRVVQGGSARYVDALTQPFRDRIRLGCPVRSIRRHPDGVEIVTAPGDGERFEEAILACHADQALRLLADPLPAERDILEAFPYRENDTVLHTDASLLPRLRRAWGSWNYHVRIDRPESATVTYHMNRLQSLKSRHEFCVTLNETDAIDPRTILRRETFHHPLFTMNRERAAARRREMIRANRISFCGAYWGFGFHEDGVRSALEVGQAFGRGEIR
jgi:predicted NAD/FAD-binding protein